MNAQRVIAAVVGCVLIWASVAKAIEPDTTVKAVDAAMGTRGESTSAAWLLISTLTAVEMGLGLALFRSHSRALVTSVAGLVLAYSVFLLWLLAGAAGVGCGCMGFRAGTAAWTNAAGLIRNAGLLGCCASLLASPQAAARRVDGSSCVRLHIHVQDRNARRTSAFTLVEVLVVVVVIATLIALVVPQLGKARALGELSKVHRTQQQLASAVLNYGNDYQETLPYLASPAAPWLGFAVEGYRVRANYFGQARYFASVLVPTWYADLSSISTRNRRASGRDQGAFECSFALTQTAFAAPTYWNDGPTPRELSHYRATRLSEAQFPSSKALLLHLSSGMYGTGASRDPTVLDVAVFDGSAGRRKLIIGLTDHTVDRPYGYAPMPTMGTRHGLAGRDF